MNFNELTLVEAGKGLRKKEFSSLEITRAFLSRIKERNPEIQAFLAVFEESALLQAEKIDGLISLKEELPPLAGIPCAVKDNILMKGLRCTGGSKILENYRAAYDATVVKLLKEQGAVFLGKTNLDEFAVGSSGEHSAFARTLNPRDFSRVPGGSSSGSAAAVADNMALFALGSDTGGSVRLPSSFCGITGFKPTYGAVSRYGLMSMASSLDQIGPLAKTAEDVRIIFEVLSQKDPLDSTSLGIEENSAFKKGNLRIGLPREYFIKGMEKGIEKICRQAADKFAKMGAEVKEISLPHTEYALPAYYIIMSSELSANLARYDGIKYGFSKRKEKDFELKELLQVYLESRKEGFGEEIRRRIMLGTYALSAGYYEAYYLKAQKVRTLIREDFNRAFEEVDLILAPVSPTIPFKIGEKTEDPLLMYLSDVFTLSANLAGLPAVSFPAGELKGLPVGVQLMGKGFADYAVLRAAEQFEKNKN
jgi:aspartyl-tRNA(Asn)/glutamyl-tRNA(Gln) amidotransferase subunit A